jgi:hypothetical protein
VAKRQSADENASPHVSLRQAVRPAMVAYGILAREQAAARTLAEEAQALLDLAADLLRKLGLVHLLTAGVIAADGADAVTGNADRLVEAYAQSGLAWAKVVSSATKLAGLLMDQEDWATGRLMADMLTAAGEIEAGKHIEALLQNAKRASLEARMQSVRIHHAMAPAEIRQAVALLSELESSPQAQTLVQNWRASLIMSAQAIATEKQNQLATQVAQGLCSRLQKLSTHPSLEDHPDYAIPRETLFSQLLSILGMCEV